MQVSISSGISKRRVEESYLTTKPDTEIDGVLRESYCPPYSSNVKTFLQSQAYQRSHIHLRHLALHFKAPVLLQHRPVAPRMMKDGRRRSREGRSRSHMMLSYQIAWRALKYGRLFTHQHHKHFLKLLVLEDVPSTSISAVFTRLT